LIPRVGALQSTRYLLTYFYPSYGADKLWRFDGRGNKPLDVAEGLLLALSKKTNTYWYTDGRVNATFHESAFFRSEIQFGISLEGVINNIVFKNKFVNN